jgi:hypothetical protein
VLNKLWTPFGAETPEKEPSQLPKMLTFIQISNLHMYDKFK